MTAKQHITLSIFTGIPLFFLVVNILNFHEYYYGFALIWFIIGCIGGSIAPDVDTPGTHANFQMFGEAYKMQSTQRKGNKFHSPKFALYCCYKPILIGVILVLLDRSLVRFLFDLYWNYMFEYRAYDGYTFYVYIFSFFGFPLLFFGIGMLYAWFLHLFHDTASASGVFWTSAQNISFKHFRVGKKSTGYIILVCMISTVLMTVSYLGYMQSYASDASATNATRVAGFPLKGWKIKKLPEFDDENHLTMEDAMRQFNITEDIPDAFKEYEKSLK